MDKAITYNIQNIARTRVMFNYSWDENSTIGEVFVVNFQAINKKRDILNTFIE